MILSHHARSGDLAGRAPERIAALAALALMSLGACGRVGYRTDDGGSVDAGVSIDALLPALPDVILPDAVLPDVPLPDALMPDAPLPDAPLPDAPLLDAPVDPCAPPGRGGCALDATCTVESGAVVCTCNAGFEGTGFVCAPSSIAGAGAFIKAINPGVVDFFGHAVAISGDGRHLAVGAYAEDSTGTGVGSVPDEGVDNSGAVYVYRRESATGPWVFEAFLRAPHVGVNHFFGHSLALGGSGELLAVGAIYENSGGTGVGSTPDTGAPASGAVYLYRRTGSAWAFEAFIKASNTGANDNFGYSVALHDGDTLAVGAPGEATSGRGVNPPTDELEDDSGAVYVYRRVAGVWTFEAFVKADNPTAGDRFGTSVALGEDQLAVGAPFEDSLAGGVGAPFDDLGENTGAVYVYQRSPGGAWGFTEILKASVPRNRDLFGFAVSQSASGRRIAVGAIGESSGGVESGAAYVFEREGTWSLEASLFASNADFGDHFGAAVALSADGQTIAVGADLEDSSGTEIDPPDDDLAPEAGAVYVFRAVAGRWGDPLFIKAPNTSGGDQFGFGVSLSGDGGTLAVGARYEDTAGAGVDPPAGDGVDDSGAVYLYD